MKSLATFKHTSSIWCTLNTPKTFQTECSSIPQNRNNWVYEFICESCKRAFGHYSDRNDQPRRIQMYSFSSFRINTNILYLAVIIRMQALIIRNLLTISVPWTFFGQLDTINVMRFEVMHDVHVWFISVYTPKQR